MKHAVSFFLLFFTYTLMNGVHSQGLDTTGWSIQDCFRYAAAHNIQISTLRLNEKIALQELYLSKGARIPSLSGSISNTFNNANNNASGTGGLIDQLTSSGSYSLSSSVVLWNDHAIRNTIRQRELLSQLSGLSIQQSINSITLFITQAYLEILLAKENEKYINDLVGSSTARVKQGQLFYDAGSIAKKDLLQMQAQLAGDKYLQVLAQNTISRDVLSLKQLLQLPSDTVFDVITPAFLMADTVLPPLKAAQENALHNFPEIKMGKMGLDIATLDIAKARAAFKPVLTANGGLGTGYNTVIINSVSSKTGYFKQAGDNLFQRAGVTLSIPIFSNRVNATNLEKANIAYRQAQLNLQNDELVLSQAIEQAYLNAINAQQAYTAADQQLQYATESYRIVNEQFKLGVINTYDLLQQRNQYVQSVQAFTQAKYTAVLQQKIYEFYMGKPVTL